jgi:hypothetical protein
MNSEACRFNESMLRQLTTEQQEQMLKSRGIKECPKCKYRCFQLFAVCPNCNFVFDEVSEKEEK